MTGGTPEGLCANLACGHKRTSHGQYNCMATFSCRCTVFASAVEPTASPVALSGVGSSNSPAGWSVRELPAAPHTHVDPLADVRDTQRRMAEAAERQADAAEQMAGSLVELVAAPTRLLAYASGALASLGPSIDRLVAALEGIERHERTQAERSRR